MDAIVSRKRKAETARDDLDLRRIAPLLERLTQALAPPQAMRPSIKLAIDQTPQPYSATPLTERCAG